MMKNKLKISTRISVSFSIITMAVSILFYFLLPSLLNYPPDTINTDFDKDVSILYYVFQYAIAVFAIILLFIIYFKISLRKIDKWCKSNDEYQIADIRAICFKYPYKLFITIEIFPVLIVLTTLALTGNHPAILLFKIGILVFSFATLVSSIFLIISKNVFYPILRDTYNYDTNRHYNQSSLVTKLVFQIFPCILVSVLLVALIGYSRLIVEKGNLLNTYYLSELNSISPAESTDLLAQYNKQLGSKLLNKNDFIFIETPEGEILKSSEHTISDFFVKYMHELSPSHNNRVYEAYTVDEQGVIKQIDYKGETYIVGIHYEIVSSSLLLYFLFASALLLIFTLIILLYMIKSINSDLNNVNSGMQGILKNKTNIEASKLPVTSNDIVGELAESFNSVQQLNKENLIQIHENQNLLIEKERLASLGQLIGGIAHNLKTPIMSISGASEGIKDLVNEFDASIGNPLVNNDDFHDIAKDMKEWLDKINSYTEYMSDILTAVKGQAVALSEQEDSDFTIGELFKRVNILMKHELKQAVVYLNISMKIDENVVINGDVNTLVQVVNNMISNSIQAYDGKPEQQIDLTAWKNDNNNIVISVKDYGPGLPEKVKNKLFKEMITTKGKNGTGLGLYMSYSTIRAHFNGDITVETEDGKGTTFNIILP